jgi:hypothetical protein
MSTTLIIALVGLGLLLMAVITVSMQQIEKGKAQRAELIAAIRSRARSFQQLLEGFPEGFLSRDLKLLVCQCWYEGIEQLAQLERKNPQIEQLRQQLQQRMEQIKAQPANAAYEPLTNPAQMQEVQKLLSNLFNAVQKLGQAKRLTAGQTTTYSAQISNLATRAGLDSHLLAAQAAMNGGKPRLAIHHYQQAIDKMTKGNADGSFNDQIAALTARVEALEAAEKAPAATANKPAAPVDDAWNKFGAPDESWKKKSQYD